MMKLMRLNVTIVIKKQFQNWCECSRTIFSLIKLVQKHSPRGREGSYDEVDELVLCLLNVTIVIMKQFKKWCECSQKSFPWSNLLKNIHLKDKKEVWWSWWVSTLFDKCYNCDYETNSRNDAPVQAISFHCSNLSKNIHLKNEKETMMNLMS